jgi:prevent-host-death family protein
MDVGVRELRDNLSRYLERVRAGEHVTVTDRGRAVARLLPIDGERRIDQLVAEGLVEPAPSRRRRPRRPVTATGPVSDLIAGQRR